MMNGWLVAKLSSNDYLLFIAHIFNKLHPPLHID